MYYFIPSWYAGKDNWTMENNPWHESSSRSEFDDSISQMRMFRKENQDIKLVLPAYGPRLRHYLHRQGLWPLRTWSAFDEMQGLSGTEICSFSYKNLGLPANLEWVYTPFAMVGLRNDEPYVCLEFGEDGSLFRADLYEKGERRRRLEFDDRGYLSSLSMLENGGETKTYFFNARQEVQFVWNRKTDQVSVSEKTDYRFKSKVYPSMKSVLTEVLTRFFRWTDEDDVILLAADDQHNDMVTDLKTKAKTVLSFFGDRYDVTQSEKLQKNVDKASFLVTDTESLSDLIRKNCDLRGKKIMDISPFDTRLSLGQSQRIRALKIFFPIDGMMEPIRSRALKQIMEVLQEDERRQLILGVRSANQADAEMIRTEMRMLLSSMENVNVTVEDTAGNASGENQVEEEQKKKRNPQVFVVTYFQEMDIMSLLRDTRLILDIRDHPDQYIQIAGISAGIPQINYLNTQYIIDRKNGYMIHNIAHLREAMLFYLEGLANWNEALVYCVQQVDHYSSVNIVNRWKALIEEHEL